MSAEIPGGQSPGKLMLIDGNSILNRAFYGLQGPSLLSAAPGLYTNALFGFLKIYLKYFNEEQPTHVCVAFDMRAPTFRHALYQDYKAGRRQMPDELASQVPLLKELLDALEILRIEAEGYEADDIIGTLASMAETYHIPCVVITGDRDALQLVSDGVRVRIPRTAGGRTTTEDYDVPAVMARYGVRPEQLIDVKALMGDASDNIPGIRGIGEKTALSLIATYGTLDRLFEQPAETFRGALAEKIAGGREAAQNSRRLAMIYRETPLGMDPEKLSERMRIKPHDRDKLIPLFQKFRFSSLAGKFGITETDMVRPAEIATPDPGTPAAEGFSENSKEKSPEHRQFTADEAADHIRAIRPGDKVYLAYTTEAGRLTGLKLKIKDVPGVIRCIPPPVEPAEPGKAEMSGGLAVCRSFLEDPRVGKVTFDMKTLYGCLDREGIRLAGVTFDTKLAAYLIDPAGAPSGETLKDILADEAVMPARLTENGQQYLYGEVELPLAEVLAEMEKAGFRVDARELVRIGEELTSRIQAIENEVYLRAGEVFNLNSTRQLADILFVKMGLPARKKTKTGYSTDSEVLEELALSNEFASLVLDYRQYAKLQGTYINGLLQIMDRRTGRVHTSFNQTVTATGRLSSTEPNLQNIPVRTDFGRTIRKAFVPENKDYLLVDADYSQIELRILAHLSEDPALMDAFRNGRDIHTETAARVFGLPEDQMDSEFRTRAKAVNFGIIYGISDFGLARQLGISRRDAKDLIDEYFRTFPGVDAFIRRCVENAREAGYVETLFRRRRYMPELKSGNHNTRQFGERAAVNTVIQGTAADIIKMAMVSVYRAFRRENLKSRLILQVHDELIVETRREETDRVTAILREAMEQAATLRVPLKIDIGKGDSWYDAK